MSRYRSTGILLLGLLLPPLLSAQAIVSGYVVSSSGIPLQSASVFIQGLAVGTLTRQDGSYTLQVPAGRFTSGHEVELRAQLIGYRTGMVTMRLTAGEAVIHNFALALDPLRLSEVVATGSGTEALRERIGSTITTVAGATIRRSNEPNVIAGIASKAPNVRATYLGGDAGASVAIQIRGAKSIVGTSQPVIFVDGIPINNSTRSLSTFGGLGQGAPAPNRAIDINSEDIESVEILKGAASASIYGATAGSAGAILITTKRGKAGRPSWTLRSTYQADEALRHLPVQRTYGVGSNGISSACSTVNCAVNPFFSFGPKLPDGTPTYDHLAEIFERGRIWDHTLSVSGGIERTTFYLSLNGMDHDGFIFGDKDIFKRYAVRFNGSHGLADNVTVSASGSYVQTSGSGADRGNTANGIGLNAARTPPEFNAKEYLNDLGLHRSYRFPNPGANCARSLPAACSRGYDNPFYAIFENAITQQTARFYGNVKADWRPMPWLWFHYTLGGDHNSDDRSSALAQAASVTPGGRLQRIQFDDRIIDSRLNATVLYQPGTKALVSLTVGQHLSETYFRQVDVTGTTWIAPKPFKLTNTTDRTVPNDAEERRRQKGYFSQVTADLHDQLFLAGRLRYGASSAFGPGDQFALYPGGSVAWSFTKAIKLPERIVSFGKLRLAYGQSGQQPSLYQQQDIFSTAAFADFNPGSLQVPTLNGIGGLYPSARKGNPAIAPERVAETEGGFDLSLFSGRADLGVTRYSTKSSKMIFPVSLPPTTGYATVSLNAGELENKGWEVVTNFRPIIRQNLFVELNASWGMNRNLVTSLGSINAQRDGLIPMPTRENCGATAAVPRCVVGFGASFGDQSTHAQVGYPLGVWRAIDFARCGRGLTTIAFGGAIHDVGAACDGKPAGALYIAANGFPIGDPSTRAVGNPEPDWTGTLAATVRFRKLELSAFLDHRQGGDVLNMTRASLYQFGIHKDTEMRGETRTFGKDMLCQNKTCDVLNGPVVGPGAGREVVIGQGWFNDTANPLGNGQGSQNGPISGRLEDGTYTRLREVSVAYSFTDAWVRKLAGSARIDVSVASRNLKLWTDYTGLDPDQNLGGASNENRGIDWFGTPLSRAWIISVSVHR